MKLYPASTHDPRVRSYLQPVRLMWQTEGDLAPRGAENLLAANTVQPFIADAPACLLREGAGLVLDFGRELHGGVRIVTAGNEPRVGRVRIRFGESVSEVMAETNNDHAMHDTVLDLAWQGGTEFGNTGFRFVRIDVPEGRRCAVELRSVLAVALYRDLDYAGSFESSDDRLDEIWRTGAYTVHLCMQDYVWDGIKRDRLVWLGDLHPELRVICAAFDDVECVQASLDFVRDHTPLPAMMNGISSYSLWWIINHHDWYLHRGDLAYLATQRDYLVGLIEQFAGYIGDDGAERLPGGRFLDWPSSGDDKAIHAGLQGLLSWALKAATGLCEALGEAGPASLCRHCRSRLRTHNPDGGMSKQANAMKVLGDIAEAGPTNANVLAVEPLNGLSTFYGYYVLQARAAAGDCAGAIDAIRTYWGAMLDFGATTFWEDFDLAWVRNAGRIDELPAPGKDDLHADFGAYCYKGLRHSLCHGWAGGPTAWLSEHVLGVQPVEPGCRTVRIAANLGDLAWAAGSFPTPHGPIRLRHEQRADGSIASDIKLPDGVTRAR